MNQNFWSSNRPNLPNYTKRFVWFLYNFPWDGLPWPSLHLLFRNKALNFDTIFNLMTAFSWDWKQFILQQTLGLIDINCGDIQIKISGLNRTEQIFTFNYGFYFNAKVLMNSNSTIVSKGLVQNVCAIEVLFYESQNGYQS